MKKFFLLLTLLLFAVSVNTYAQEKTVVTPYNKALITTGGGLKSHKLWATFPSEERAVRKIVLKLTLATPEEDYMSCAHWDYLDRLILVRCGSADSPALNYEIARMLTPYGGHNPKGWEFTWEVDVTDFASLLRGDVELNYTHAGWESNKDRGWALTTEFEFTYGEPSSEVVAIHKVYDDCYRYGDESNPIEQHLAPYTFIPNKKTTYVRSVTFQTGHGADSLNNSEFTSKWRKLFFNGKEVDYKDLWTEGGDNPLYPQAGTWLYDRANWIPGMLIDPDVCNIVLENKKESVFDFDMEPYVMPVKPSADQQITSYLIEYKTKRKNTDAELFDIVVPSDKDIYSRRNPSTSNPVIIVKNHGLQPITSMLISYAGQTMEWKGNIKALSRQEITLDGFVDNTKSEFTAEILSVNGKKDSYTADNKLTSTYSPAPTHRGDMVFRFTTNKKSNEENSVTLYNIATGEKLIHYAPHDLENEQKYSIEKQLPNGIYLFEMTDSEGDGLTFWAKKDAGTGSCFIENGEGQLVKYFTADFGNSIRYWFIVDNSLEKDNVQGEPVIQFGYLENNMVRVYFRVNDKETPLNLTVKDYVGKEVFTTTVDPKTGMIDLDMSKCTKGLYFLTLGSEGKEKTTTLNR